MDSFCRKAGELCVSIHLPEGAVMANSITSGAEEEEEEEKPDANLRREGRHGTLLLGGGHGGGKMSSYERTDGQMLRGAIAVDVVVVVLLKAGRDGTEPAYYKWKWAK
ncbi:hypothetical protein GPALN_012450 [Globodera pallida]|nr:hypothetical protein GPALN_012450 [Globodera pallida]